MTMMKIDYEEDNFMNPDHERWDEFYEKLEGVQGCNFRKDENGKIKFNCNGDFSKTEIILEEMGFNEEQIDRSLQYFSNHGGYCDCEILLNVEASFWR
jgi:hypothetical protein